MCRTLREFPFSGVALLVAISLCSSVQAGSRLNFPRLSFKEDTLTGVAIVNPSAQDAVVTLTAYGEDGQPLAGISNPARVTVRAKQQFSKLTSELFGSGPDPSTVAWFQATSTVDGLTGFFLFLNSSATRFDGADLPGSAVSIVFNQVRVEADGTTELNIINPSGSTANLQLELVGAGPTPITKTLSLAANGVARLDAGSFFEISAVSLGAYVKVTSDVEIAGFEFVKASDADLVGLNARSASEQLTNLFFPQLVALGPWKTELGMVNYSSQPVIVTISVYKPDGSLYDPTDVQNNPVTRSLGGGQSLNEDVAQMFGFSGAQTLDGWLQVEATSESINGFISYGLPSSGSIASVTSSGEGQKRGIFSHIATVGGFFTGVAILNSGQLATDVRVLAIQPSGEILGSFNTVLQPRERLSKLINELIPEAAGQGGGLIWVKSALPVHLTSLFGSSSILANIPAQAAPDSYQPDAVLASLKVSPSLAIVQPGQSQTFQMTGATGSVLWKVNGVSGGNPSIGTISGQGVYQAPAAVPDPRVLTVTGEVSGQVAGASVDVLEKETLLTSTAIVQTVAYLGSLQRLYIAELEVLGSAGDSPQAAGTPTQQVAKSEIFEVAAGGIKTSVVSFPGEEIAKMISFLASNGKELLLLAAKASGKVIRLDPTTKETTDVATGLNQPDALVIDLVSGDLLVAELDKITTVARTQLEAGLSPAARGSERARGNQAAELFPAQGANGIAVNNCTRNVFISNKQTGEILEYVRTSGELRTVVSGLTEPTELLAIYRAGVSCPDSFHLLVIEQGTDRILLILPLEQLATPWIAARQGTDIAFLSGGSLFATSEAILLTEAVEGQQTQQNGGFAVSAVTVPYRAQPVNTPPPPIEKPEPQPKGVVEFTAVSQQGLVVECTDGSTVESQTLLDARIQGELEQNRLPSMSGSFTGSFQESFQGTGIFSESGACTMEGSFQVVINQPTPPESATDLAGSWTFLLEGIERCDDGSVDTLREGVKFDVTQIGNEFSGSFLEGGGDFFFPPECTVTCPNPGECTAECPGFGACTIGCDPATPGCAEQIQISGTVGSVVAFTAVSQQVLVIECAGSTGEARTSLEVHFQGELPQNDVRLISGAFTADETESCQGTGFFSQVQCFGPETSEGSFEVVIRQAQPPESPTDISGSWTLIIFDQDGEDDEDNVFVFDVTQTGNEVSGSFLDQEEEDSFLPQECAVTCPNPGECTAVCPGFGTCTITCDPATPNCAAEVRISGTVRSP